MASLPVDSQAPHSWLASVRETKAVLSEFGLCTKHRLGQNFLVSDEVIGKILSLAELGDEDVVLEVGPGIGTLTVALLGQAAAVVSVEADRSLEPVLAETCARDSDRFALVLGDALRQDEGRLREALASLDVEGLAELPSHFVANLPYQVAATLILKFLQELPSLARAVVMVQAEVADRIAARPGSKAYGAYTAKLALFGRVTGRFEVGPGNFMPPPHVDSAVVRIDRSRALGPVSGEPLTDEQCVWAMQVIDAAFAQRRKTIRNSMSAKGFDRDTLDVAFAELGISPAARAETLSPEDFVRLAERLSEERGTLQETDEL
ncbi:16S rRNA (adenine(1518)-N(6)/adenine(1519)-N(6))-dimethyltransferase RsmA [Olsenella urininfantis]|uniref:16S rRNA (adenine(1518)-N(6)/adenine(1519)-N(6))- dimethyltransferase RsmA n=1 Tax=Olsenella urininfantis TaxID=1871033 RepID=UPI0009855098|nr:16S rRNA (adenine(1518)-N(6)/adenine(1519)-N(6))-dimethyltransferase RsmA [Olsenella urininfantis]